MRPLSLKLIYIDNLGKDEPLAGAGSYGLTDVTQIYGTEAFLGLHTGIKRCQNKETFRECQARELLKQARCKCTP